MGAGRTLKSPVRNSNFDVCFVIYFFFLFKLVTTDCCQSTNSWYRLCFHLGNSATAKALASAQTEPGIAAWQVFAIEMVLKNTPRETLEPPAYFYPQLNNFVPIGMVRFLSDQVQGYSGTTALYSHVELPQSTSSCDRKKNTSGFLMGKSCLNEKRTSL